MPNVPLLKDKRLKTVPLFENEVDLIVGDEEEKRLASRHEMIKIWRGEQGFYFEDKCLKSSWIERRELDLIVGGGEEKRLGGLLESIRD